VIGKCDETMEARMSEAVWLEIALNGPWSRDRQPNIPVQAQEIVDTALACVGEGASIVHFHAYDAISGRQRDEYEIYAPIIERIRARCDVICYGTLPFAGSVDSAQALSAPERFNAVERLAQAGLIEWSVVDPGSTNISHYSDIEADREGFVYANPESHVRYGLELAQRHALTPSYAIYEPGFMRLGAALHRRYPGAPTPVYRLMFSQGIAFGFPPTPWALEAYTKLLDHEHPGAPWMVAGLSVELGPVLELAVARGGHVRVGLEDAPIGCPLDNLTITRAARQRIEAAGRCLASPKEVRGRLSTLPLFPTVQSPCIPCKPTPY
jgi:3-keto-5-aminohexanoate cleavage enzyme